MHRLSATATIAALLLLAIAQGFGATSSTKSVAKSTPKVATKSTAKPYHITAQNQFHFTSTRHASPALARRQSEEQQHTHGPHGRNNAANSAGRAPAQARAMKPRRNAANPPTGKIGFVSATQIPEGGENRGDVQVGTLGTSTAFITVVQSAAGVYSYSEVAANGDGTFTAPAATLTAIPNNESNPAFVVADVNGDGNSDIVQADSPGTITVLLSNGDGTFTAAAAGVGPASPFTITPANSFTGGALVMNATSGFLDLVIVDDLLPSNIVTYAGNGDGTFGLIATVPITGTSVALIPPAGFNGLGFNVIITDYDGDGTVDVSENDGTNGELVVYLSSATVPYTGTATNTPDGNHRECNATSGVLTGTNPAIVESNCSQDTITVYNNTAGVFSEGVYYPVVVTPSTKGVAYPEAATIADVNGDGNADVVSVNDDGSDVTILIGNGDGTLQLASVGYAVGGFPFKPAIVTDLNGDGLVDILVADDNQSLVWMAGFGDGTFQAAKDFYSPVPDNNDFAFSEGVATGDFNGDGIPDVVVGNCCDNSVGITVFLSNPDGSMQPGVNYSTGGTLEWVTVSDFNGDGKLDIAASDDTGSVLIFTGTGTGTFIEGPIYSSGGSFPQGIVAGAFNTSTGVAGFNDLVVTNESSANVGVLLNDGSGGFMGAVTYGLTASGAQLAAADLTGTGTGNLSLAIAEDNGHQVGVLLGNGDGTFTAAADVPMGTSFPYGITLADVSGDTFPDIVVADDNQNILVATGHGDGTFPNTLITLPSSVIVTGTTPFYSPDPSSVQVADVDGDGFMDLVYTNADYSTVGVIFGQGTGTGTAPTFFDPVEFPAGGFIFDVSVADVNGDGTPDAVTAADDFAGTSVLINANGTGGQPSFSLSAASSFINVSDGGTQTDVITVTPTNFYNGTITFSCGSLPLGATCAFSPATVTPLGNAALQTTLTVSTLAPHSSLRMPADTNPHQGRTSLLACLTGMGLFGMLLAGDWKNKRNRRVGILLGLLVLGMMFSLVGCSSSSKPGTPIGAQTIAVTATGSSGTPQSINITVNVF